MIRIAKNNLVRFGTEFLKARGMPESNAQFIAEMAVETEALGITTHGLSVLFYLDSQIPDTIAPDIEPEIISDKQAAVLIDGNEGPSQIAMKLARKMAVSKAREFGIGIAGIRNAKWIGALGPFLIPIARDGLFAQMFCQSSQCGDCAPFGGLGPKFSTNPMALAFPTSGDPVVADFSTASVSMGQLHKLVREGKKADDRIFLDKEGTPTDDPNVFKEGGSVTFMGGHAYGYKGYSLSLWTEALTAMIGGTANNPDKPQSQNLTLMVVNPEFFAGYDTYYKEMERFLAHVKESRPRDGFEKIRFPGEGGFAKLKKADAEGVPLDEGVLEQINRICSEYNLDPLI